MRRLAWSPSRGYARAMRIAVTGSSGLIGRALTSRLEAAGHDVLRVVRRSVPDRARGEAHWDPALGVIDAEQLEGLGAAVHLAGENVAEGRWTAEKKAAIRRSRVGGTRLLAGALAAVKMPPLCLLSASATGYYGDRGDEVLDEESTPGRGFLADTCRAWESATDVAAEAGVRVVHLRFGVVLTPEGGALQKLGLPFRMGVGGRIGSGRQYMPWVSRTDAVGAILHALKRSDVCGPVNVVAPEAVTNGDFTRALGRALKRPTLLPLPAFVARALLGEMADEMLLAGQRARPKVLEDTSYAFQHPALEPTLRRLLPPTRHR